MAVEAVGKVEASKSRVVWRKVLDRFMDGFIKANSVVVVLSVLLIFAFLIKESVPFFKERTLGSLLTGREWYPLEPSDMFGALPLIGGTIVTAFLAILMALPIGVTCAVYMSEMAPTRLKNVLKSTVEVLAGIPSVVIGFIGLTVLGPFLKETVDRFSSEPIPSGLTALTGAILLSLMAMPTIISISEDALNAVPKDYRLASLGLGGTKLQTIWRIVVPAASRGILAATMLGIGRAVGETMTVLMATGNAANVPEKFLAPIADNSLFQSIRTLTATIAAEMGETPVNSLHYHALFALGVILFVMTFVVNTVADLVISKGKKE